MRVLVAYRSKYVQVEGTSQQLRISECTLFIHTNELQRLRTRHQHRSASEAAFLISNLFLRPVTVSLSRSLAWFIIIINAMLISKFSGAFWDPLVHCTPAGVHAILTAYLCACVPAYSQWKVCIAWSSRQSTWTKWRHRRRKIFWNIFYNFLA